MIIEFVGLPGSGKSTQRERLREVLAGRELRLDDVTNRRTQALARRVPADLRRTASVFAHPGVARAAAGALLRSPRSASERLFAARLFGVTLDNHRQLRRYLRPGEATLVDEGLLQRTFLLFAGPGEQGAAGVARYARHVPLPDVAIYLRLPETAVSERLADRPRSLPPRFARLDPAAQQRALADGAALLEDLLDRVGRRADAPQVVTIDADNFDQTSKAIDDLVLPVLRN